MSKKRVFAAAADDFAEWGQNPATLGADDTLIVIAGREPVPEDALGDLKGIVGTFSMLPGGDPVGALAEYLGHCGRGFHLYLIGSSLGDVFTGHAADLIPHCECVYWNKTLRVGKARKYTKKNWQADRQKAEQTRLNTGEAEIAAIMAQMAQTPPKAAGGAPATQGTGGQAAQGGVPQAHATQATAPRPTVPQPAPATQGCTQGGATQGGQADGGITVSTLNGAKGALSYFLLERLRRHIYTEAINKRPGNPLTDTQVYRCCMLLLRADSPEAFMKSWSVMEKDVAFDMDDVMFSMLKEEADFYNRVCFYLYEGDRW